MTMEHVAATLRAARLCARRLIDRRHPPGRPKSGFSASGATEFHTWEHNRAFPAEDSV